MLGELKHLETMGLTHSVNSNFACDISDDNKIYFLNSKGVYVFQMCLTNESIWPTLSMKKYFIPCSSYDFSIHLDINVNEFYYKLPRNILYECLLTQNFQNMGFYGHVEYKVLSASWSPLYVSNNGDSVIAVLNNVGGLILYQKSVDQNLIEDYVELENITELYINQVKRSWSFPNQNEPENLYEELIKRSEQIKPTAFTWSNIFKSKDDKKFCYLIVSHINGDISFWKINEKSHLDDAEGRIKFSNKISTDLYHITTLSWKKIAKRVILLTGNLVGAVKLNVLSKSDETVTISKSLQLMNEDEIAVSYVNVSVFEDKLFVIILKRDCLYVFLMSERLKTLDLCKFHLQNIIVTDVKQLSQNKFVVLFYNGEMKEISTSIVNGKVNVEWKFIYADFSWVNRKTNGLILSKNKVLAGILFSQKRTTMEHRSDFKSEMVAFFSNKSIDPLSILLKKEKKSLINYWDCFEIIRITAILDKKLPAYNIETIMEMSESSSLIDLKTLAVLLRIFEMVYEQIYYLEDVDLKTPLEKVNFTLNTKLLVYRMQHLLEIKERRNELSEFQLQNLEILSTHLKEIVLRESCKMESNPGLSEEVLEILSKTSLVEFKDPPVCYFCKQSVYCVPHHFDMRCFVSLMQINLYSCYKCPLCKCLIHKEIDKEYTVMVCPLCDSPLELVKLKKIIPSPVQIERAESNI